MDKALHGLTESPQPITGTPTPSAPFIGALQVALGKRLPAPPSDRPALDRAYLTERYPSLRPFNLGFTYF